MALIKTHCNKCGSDFNIDAGDKTNEEIQKILESRTEFECYAGKHFEMDSPAHHWVLGERIEGSAPSEAEWYKTMSERYGKLYSNDELTENFEIKNFAFGACMATNLKTNKDVCLEFISSPKGNRFYHE